MLSLAKSKDVGYHLRQAFAFPGKRSARKSAQIFLEKRVSVQIGSVPFSCQQVLNEKSFNHILCHPRCELAFKLVPAEIDSIIIGSVTFVETLLRRKGEMSICAINMQ